MYKSLCRLGVIGGAIIVAATSLQAALARSGKHAKFTFEVRQSDHQAAPGRCP